MRETVPAVCGGERLDRTVAMMTGVSRSVASRLIASGEVTLDGRAVTTSSARVEAGSLLCVEVPAEAGPVIPVADDSVSFSVLYEDESVVVVDKPAGVVVHPGSGHTDHTLVSGLLARYPDIASVGDAERPGIVHRLDRDTSGLMVVARTEEARASLVGQLSERTVARNYRALVWGHLDSPAGRIEAPIGRSARRRTAMAVTGDGREARTDYEVVSRYRSPVEVSLLECSLHTGRTHQIRVHLSSIGHPVVGDDLYGGSRPSFGVPRMWLHARRLQFRHPRTDETMVFESELPGELSAVLGELS